MISLDNNNSRATAWKSQTETFAAHAARMHVPLRATFELTARCSLKCKMCYVALDASQVQKEGRELTAAEWLSISRQTADAGTLFLLLTGGEPLLRDDFEEIYTELCHMGFIITLATNATLMSERYFKLFSRYPPTAVMVTLYGASSETYEKICGSAAGFEKTIRGLEMFSKIPTNIEVRTTFIKDNAGELEQLRAISKRFTNRFGINNLVFKSNRSVTSDAESCRLTPGQCMEIEAANRKYYENLEESEREPVDPEVEEYFRSLSPDRDFGLGIPPKIIACLASKSMYSMTWDGKMLPCLTFESPYTLPFEEGFVNAWNRLPTLFDNIKHPKACYECDLISGCPNCPGYMQIETGEFEKLSPYFCAVAKERMAWYTKSV